MNKTNYALVIEDSHSMRDYVSLILKQDAHIDHIIEAESPDQALEILNAQTDQPSLIISNWNMPGMPLQEFMLDIKSRPELAETAIFLLSSSSEEKAECLAQKIHAHAVLTKPFEADSLVALINEHIGFKERRRAKRVTPLKKCSIDLGFDDTQPAFSAEVINISETGILLNSPLPLLGAGYIYDFSSLVLQPEDGDPIKVYAQIVRLESDRKSLQQGNPRVTMALDFGRLDEMTLNKIRRYIIMNEPSENDSQH